MMAPACSDNRWCGFKTDFQNQWVAQAACLCGRTRSCHSPRRVPPGFETAGQPPDYVLVAPRPQSKVARGRRFFVAELLPRLNRIAAEEFRGGEDFFAGRLHAIERQSPLPCRNQ